MIGGTAAEEEDEEEEGSGREAEEVGGTGVEEVPRIVEVGSRVGVGRVGMEGGGIVGVEGRMGGGGVAEVL